MCGIAGYIGRRDAESILIEGLYRLEYRGYDSAGIAVVRGALRLQDPGKGASSRAASAREPEGNTRQRLVATAASPILIQPVSQPNQTHPLLAFGSAHA